MRSVVHTIPSQAMSPHLLLAHMIVSALTTTETNVSGKGPGKAPDGTRGCGFRLRLGMWLPNSASLLTSLNASHSQRASGLSRGGYAENAAQG